ncbi:hypothetical protein [Plesiomonas sp. PI-19]|uniref:hypothetical protein n=1 Tax=Plesiomonas sp. PI-19 TaxID=2898798 RepID=UPI001F413B25|nr:hypothetical protein [Plesiomonas sp. PI-19]MCE5165599.1 hypothetical protein [Plesiomonas sp. PI-19]
MSDNTLQQDPSTNDVLALSQQDIKDVLIEVFKRTGQKISVDDPVLAVAVSSNLFIERISSIIKSDIESCYAGWERVISESENRHLERINNISDVANKIEEESLKHIQKLSGSIADEKNGIVEEGIAAKERFRADAREILEEIRDEFKKQASGYKPLKKSTLIGFAFCGALALSAAFSSGAYLYLQEKANNQIQSANKELKTVLMSSSELIDFTQKTIKSLPTKQQKEAQKEFERIIN